MRNCFVCTTPYQILAVISLAEDLGGLSDLYIVSQFEGAKILANRLKAEKIFDEVIFIDEEKLLQKYHRLDGPVAKRIGIIHAYSDTDKIVEQFICNEDEYNHLFISSNGIIAQLILLYLHKHYGLSSYSYFDDGIGSYCSDVNTKISTLALFCRQIFVDKRAYKLKSYDLYMYNKRLYQLMHKNENHKVYQFKFICNNSENLNLVCRIFGLRNINIIKENIIVLDSLKDKELKDDGISLLVDLFDIITNKVGQNNLIFKAHPRDNNPIAKYNYLDSEGDVNLPFEIYGMAQNLSDKILITNMSTAVFSPKLVLNQEPTIILLYRILNNYLLNRTKIDEVVCYFKKIYNDPSKIYVPQTVEELERIIDNIIK